VVGGDWLFCGVGALCGNGGEGFMGFGGGLELPLIKGLFRGRGLLNSCLKGSLASFFAQPCEQGHKHHQRGCIVIV